MSFHCDVSNVDLYYDILYSLYHVINSIYVFIDTLPILLCCRFLLFNGRYNIYLVFFQFGVKLRLSWQYIYYLINII